MLRRLLSLDRDPIHVAMILIAGGQLLMLGVINSPVRSTTSDTWSAVRPGQDSLEARGIGFADQMNGVIVGKRGMILRTQDGGLTWKALQGGTTEDLWAVAFPETKLGCAVGARNTVGISTDAGETWTWQHPVGDSACDITGLSFVDPRNGWIADTRGGIRRTTDGGVSWKEQSSGLGSWIESIDFQDPWEGWAIAGWDVLHTGDGGEHWYSWSYREQRFGQGYPVAFTCICSRHGRVWIGTMSGLSSSMHARAPVIYSADRGDFWIAQRTPAVTFIHTIRFLDDSAGWAGTNCGIMHTTDGGISWDMQLSLERTTIRDICVGTKCLWAVTSAGAVYRYVGR